MGFYEAHGSIYRTTPLYGCTRVTMVERATEGAGWQLAKLPRDTVVISADVAREAIGAELVDTPSVFGTEPEARSESGLDVRVNQLTAMIETTVAWMRSTAPGIDEELKWARYQSADYDLELDTRNAIGDGATLLGMLMSHRGDILARNEMRRLKQAEEDAR